MASNMTDAPQPTLLGEFLSNEEINIIVTHISISVSLEVSP